MCHTADVYVSLPLLATKLSETRAHLSLEEKSVNERQMINRDSLSLASENQSLDVRGCKHLFLRLFLQILKKMSLINNPALNIGVADLKCKLEHVDFRLILLDDLKGLFVIILQEFT